MMREVSGAAAAREALSRGRGRQAPLPAGVADAVEKLFGQPLTPGEVAGRIIADVRARGDEAVREWTRRIDGVEIDDLMVPVEPAEFAEVRLPREVRDALALAADRLTAYFERQPRGEWRRTDADGNLGQLVRPIERVGVYVPGGTAPLVSSLLHTAIPARVAGVGRIVVASPPTRTGEVPPELLFAAKLAGADAFYRIGGVQAIAALAYGTATIEKVDLVAGPGNAFVVAAKRAVYGDVGVDLLPGPTETLIVADETADPRHVALDLIAQAEHDLSAQAVLLTTSPRLAADVHRAVAAELTGLPRAGIAGESLRANGLIAVVEDMESALEVVNAYGPEHLCLMVADPERALAGVRNAGGVFLGAASMEALGDYLAGPSHVMPTMGTARFASAVNLWTYLKVIPVIALGEAAASRLAPPAALLARAEGLEGHARALESRSPAHALPTTTKRSGQG